MGSRVVHVHIHGQQYALRSDLDPQHLSELAAYLDEKMRLASREIASADIARVAIIAALNITDELFRARTDGLHGQLLHRAAEIERLVDQVLGEARPKIAAVGG